MKIQNFAHDSVAVVRLLPENDEDERTLMVTRMNLSRFTCSLSTWITLGDQPRKALSIIFTHKEEKLP